MFILWSQHEDLLRQLEIIGLSGLQAKVYVTLHTLREASANTVAEASQIHRVEAYRILKELIVLGAVEQVIAHPIRYRVRHPEETLKNLLAPFVEQLSELSEARTRVLAYLAITQPSEKNVDLDDSFELLRGKQVLKRMNAMIDRASHEILYASRISQDGLGLSNPFHRALERGVRAKGLLNIDRRDVEIVKGFKRSKRVIRKHSDKVYSWGLVVDGKEIIFSSAPDAHPDEVFLYTRNPRFIKHYSRSFELLFRNAVPIEKHIQKLI